MTVIGWRRLMTGVALTTLGAAGPLHAQAKVKADSLLLTLPMPKAEAFDRVVEAMTAVGLTPTNTTPVVIESDQGVTSSAIGSIQRHRVVRATLLAHGDSTRVLLRATEAIEQRGQVQRTVTLSNRSSGHGGTIWRKMVALGDSLTPGQVADALKSDLRK